jgi:TRAP-type C4-dicarboxylate transport system substrate-binding protein
MKLPVSSRVAVSRIIALAGLLCFGGAVGSILGAIPTAATAREFRAADTQVEEYPTVQALLFMGRLIAEQTAGRDQTRVFHSRQLGEEKETIEQTRAGAIDLNRTNVALIGSFVLAMPFLFRSIEHLHKVLDGPIGREILGSFEPYGFVGLTFYDSGARSIYNRVRPVRSIADLQGLRIRVQQSKLMSNMIRALGAEPVELPYGQVLTGLEARSRRQAEAAGVSIVTDFDRKPFESAMAGLYTEAQRDPATAELIERIRKVE